MTMQASARWRWEGRSGFASGALRLLREWGRRRLARAALAAVQPRDLRDAGLTLAGVEHEANRPFWTPLSPDRT